MMDVDEDLSSSVVDISSSSDSSEGTGQLSRPQADLWARLAQAFEYLPSPDDLIMRERFFQGFKYEFVSPDSRKHGSLLLNALQAVYERLLGVRILCGKRMESSPKFLTDGFKIALTSDSMALDDYAFQFNHAPADSGFDDNWWEALRFSSFPAVTVSFRSFTILLVLMVARSSMNTCGLASAFQTG